MSRHSVAFGGLARTLLYDNLKSVVLERVGEAIRFNPELLSFAKHYRFEPRPVAVARGNEKGRVERQIDFIRKAFFAARKFDRRGRSERAGADWCEGQAFERPWPEDDSLSVRQAFAVEQPRCSRCPRAGFALGERLDVAVAKTPYVRFDLNDYTVPHTHVRRTVSVLADEQRELSPPFLHNLRHCPQHSLPQRHATLLTAIARLLLPVRPNRVEPRAVKRRPKPHRLLTQPRNILRAHLEKRQRRILAAFA